MGAHGGPNQDHIEELNALRAAVNDLEARYKSLVEQIPAITYIADLDEQSTTLFISPQVEEILGIEPREWAENSDIWLDQIHPEDRKRVLSEVASSHRDGSPFLSEYRMVSRDKKIVWIRDQALIVKNGRGEPVCMQGVMFDITESRKTEDALRESEVRFMTALESLPFDVFIIGEDGRYVLQNQTCIRHWGNVVGKRPEDVAPDEETRRLWRNNNQRAFAGEIVAGEVSVKISGEDLNFHNVIAPVRDADRIRGILGVNIDITERKRAEEEVIESEAKFRNLAEQSPNMIFINKMGRVVYVNAMCEKIMGYSREDFYSPDFDFLSLIAPESLDLVRGSFSEHVKGNDVPPYEYTLKTKDGREIEAINATKLIRFEGEHAILGIVTDISEHKESERKLKDASRQLEQERESLAEKNIALRQILTHIEKERHDYKQQICREVEQIVKPFLAQLKENVETGRSDRFENLESKLSALLTKDIDLFRDRYSRLTPRELSICDLIRAGRSSKQVASELNISLGTVHKHREQIRRKLGIANKEINLGTYLKLYY